MDLKIKNKNALITGGSRGLGKEAAIHLAREGVKKNTTYSLRTAPKKKGAQKISKVLGWAVSNRLLGFG